MNKYRKPNFSEKNLGKSPFLSSLQITVSSIHMKGQYIKDKDDEWMPVYREAESDTSCRVYNSSERRLKMSKLSSSAKGLLLWIIYEAENNKDYLWVNRKRYQEENGIASPTTFRSAINELIGEAFICRTKVGAVYWINPALFFNGNRVKTFSDKVVER